MELITGRTLELEFRLTPVSLEGQTVEITAQASGQNEAINQQLSSLQIKNVVSLARIQELPDANAAESVARLPGVSIIRKGGEGSQVVIRGLSPQYNQITIDGVQLPGNVVSNNPNEQGSIVGDRATDLSMISSSMLGGIEVIKAITPDMDAAVLGGVVNFGLRKAAKGNFNSPTFGLTTQGSYNDLKNTYNDYLLVGSYEQRFFDQSFGIFLQGSTERRNRSANQLGVSYSLVDKTHGDDGIPDINMVNLNDVFSEKKRSGATLVLDYEHENGQIGLMNFVSNSKTKSEYRGQSISPVGDDLFYSATDADNRLNVITNLLSIQQEIPLFHIDLKLSHTYSESRNPEDLTIGFWQDYAGFSGLGDLTKSNPKTIAGLAQPNSSVTKFSSLATSENFSQDRAVQASIDLQTQVIISDYLTGKFKFGGLYHHRNRSYDINYAEEGAYELGGFYLIPQAYPEMEVYQSCVTLTNFIDKSYSTGNFLNGDYPLYYPINIDFMKDFYRFVRSIPLGEGYFNNAHGSHYA